MTDPLRVVVWSTGGVGANAIRGISRRRDMSIVGVWVHSPDKVGTDAGELAGIERLGIRATNDAESLISLQPDCVVYSATGPTRDAAALEDYIRLLRSGINVVTTTSTRLVYPPTYAPADLQRLAEAAAHGGASIYASGIFPGFASDALPLMLATQSMRISKLTASEISLNDHYPVAEPMIEGMGFSRGLDFEPWLLRPGAIAAAWSGPIHLIADGLGVHVQDVQGTLRRELTHRTLQVAFGTIPAGTVGAVWTRAAGIVDGREAIVVEHIIRMSRDVAPEWPQSDADATYCVDIEGDPDIHCSMTMGAAEGYAAGEAAMTATAMRVVNAVPYVVAAQPGLLSSLDLAMTLPRNSFQSN